MTIAALAGLLAAPAVADTRVELSAAGVIRQRVLALVNHARAQPRRCGDEQFAAAQPLRFSSTLIRAARAHALDMARHDYFEHAGRDGSAPRDRVARLGYRSRLTGENLAFGPESAEEVVAGWLASPGHCANIMDPRFREMGLAVASGRKRGAIYWVQNLAWPRG